jgi:NAD(P)-dependent dehydrogenase (short-subunit alcohol dehydrogenase family)
MERVLDSALQAYSLKGKHIAVVGASSGIGAGVSVLASELGATITLMARRRAQLDEVRARCDKPDRHHVATMDAADPVSVENAFREAREIRGSFSGMVYAAGIAPLRPIQVLTSGHLDEVLAVNLKGAMLAVRALTTKGGLAQDGSILFISSAQAHVAGGAGTAAYAASKAGLEAAQRIFALELAPRKIRVNALAVGPVRTAIWNSDDQELSRKVLANSTARTLLGLGEVENVAHAAAFLLSPASRWITGATLAVDGGLLSHNRIGP